MSWSRSWCSASALRLAPSNCVSTPRLSFGRAGFFGLKAISRTPIRSVFSSVEPENDWRLMSGKVLPLSSCDPLCSAQQWILWENLLLVMFEIV